MAALRQVVRTVPSGPSAALRTPSLASSASGRSPACRRLLSSSLEPCSSPSSSRPLASPALASLRSPFLPSSIAALQARGLHQSARCLQDQPQQAPPRAEPKPAKPEEQSGKPKDETDAKAQSEAKEEGEKEGDKTDKDEAGAEGEKKEKKEDLPPPPPHGDKTPWQVFMETMQSEFKASKEWNDSTKQLAAGANDFIESERVRKAREAYEATTGAVSSSAGKAFKASASAIGKGATWTWDTSVMKGVRKGANVTGDALDRATKPLRETEAYKNVKEVIDDGSSSRYGGWVEKEERRKARELREKQAAMLHGKPEDMVEDPKCAYPDPPPKELC